MAATGTQGPKADLILVPQIDPQDLQRVTEEFRRRFQQGTAGATTITPDPAQARRAGQQLGTAVQHGVTQANPGQAVTQSVQHSTSGPQAESLGRKLGSKIAVGIAAIGIGKILHRGLEESVDIHDSNKILQAQLDLSPAEAKKAGKVAGNIYSQAYGSSMEEVNTAVNGVIGAVGGMNKISSKELEDLTKKALNLSSAFGVDTAESVTLISEMVQNKLVPDTATGMDKLTKGLQKVPAAFRGDLIDGLREYTPYLASLGYTADDAFSLFIKGSKNGAIGMDKAGDALKEFGIRATDMSASSQGAYKTLGLNAAQTSKAVMAGGSSAKAAIHEISSRLLAIKDPVKRSNTAIALFGTQLEDLGTNGSGLNDFLGALKDTKSSLGDTTGAADKMNKTLNSTEASSAVEVQRTFSQVIGQIMLPLMEAALPILQSFAGWLNDNKDAIKAWAGPILLIGGAIAGLMTVLNIAGGVIGGITAIADLFGLSLAGIGAGFLAAAGPVLLVIAAIAIIVGLIWYLAANWDAVVAEFSNGWNQIVGAGQYAWSLVVAGFQAVVAAFANGWNQIVGGFQAVMGAFGNGWNQIVGFFTGAWSAVIGSFANGWSQITGFFTGAANFITGLYQGVINFVLGGFNGLIGGINGMLSFVFGAINAVSSALSSISGGLIQFGVQTPQIPTLGGVTLPHLANGGLIPATSGGTAAVLGEAGRNEIVMNEGVYNAQQASQSAVNLELLKLLHGGSNGAPKQNIFHIDAKHMTSRELQTTLNARERFSDGL